MKWTKFEWMDPSAACSSAHLSVRCSAVRLVPSLRAPGTPDPPTGSPVSPTCSPVGRRRLETGRRRWEDWRSGHGAVAYPAAEGRKTPCFTSRTSRPKWCPPGNECHRDVRRRSGVLLGGTELRSVSGSSLLWRSAALWFCRGRLCAAARHNHSGLSLSVSLSVSLSLSLSLSLCPPPPASTLLICLSTSTSPPPPPSLGLPLSFSCHPHASLSDELHPEVAAVCMCLQKKVQTVLLPMQTYSTWAHIQSYRH